MRVSIIKRNQWVSFSALSLICLLPLSCFATQTTLDPATKNTMEFLRHMVCLETMKQNAPNQQYYDASSGFQLQLGDHQLQFGQTPWCGQIKLPNNSTVNIDELTSALTPAIKAIVAGKPAPSIERTYWNKAKGVMSDTSARWYSSAMNSPQPFTAALHQFDKVAIAYALGGGDMSQGGSGDYATGPMGDAGNALGEGASGYDLSSIDPTALDALVKAQDANVLANNSAANDYPDVTGGVGGAGLGQSQSQRAGDDNGQSGADSNEPGYVPYTPSSPKSDDGGNTNPSGGDWPSVNPSVDPHGDNKKGGDDSGQGSGDTPSGGGSSVTPVIPPQIDPYPPLKPPSKDKQDTDPIHIPPTKEVTKDYKSKDTSADKDIHNTYRDAIDNYLQFAAGPKPGYSYADTWKDVTSPVCPDNVLQKNPTCNTPDSEWADAYNALHERTMQQVDKVFQG